MRGFLFWMGSLLLAATALASCDDEEEGVVASCKAGLASDKSRMCIDYDASDNLDQWRMACRTVMRGKWSKSPCDTKETLGGCKVKTSTIWLYPSTKHETIEDAKESCTKGTFLSPPAVDPQEP